MTAIEKDIVIRQLTVGAYQVNTYIVSCTQSKQAVIIDPGGEAAKISKMIEEEGLVPVFLLNTHGHADHVLANQALRKAFSIPICMHEADDRFFARPDIRRQIEKELGLPVAGPVDRHLADGQVLEVGGLRIEVLHTPGHSPGSVCFSVAGHLFTGDTLFVGDVGRTDLAGGSLETLLASLRKIIQLPKDTIIHPGHDYGESPTSTLAWEMQENPYITDFILADS